MRLPGRGWATVIRTVTVLVVVGTLVPPWQARAQLASCFVNPPAPIPTEVGVGNGPIGLVLADFDLDGRLDLATANNGATFASVRIRGATGTFDAAANITGLSAPASIAVGRVDADELPDLIIPNNVSPGAPVAIRLGNGDGTFDSAPNVIVTGSTPGVAVGDFDLDTNLDIAVIGASTGVVSIRLGNGDGTFDVGTTLTGFSSPSDVAVGVFNTNGRPDVVVVNRGGNNVTLLPGNGNGTFGPGMNVPVGNSPRSVAVGDLDGDGKLDLAVANANDDDVSIRLGNGDGSFDDAPDVPVVDNPSDVAIGDVNGDGRADLVVVNEISPGGTVSVRLGNGDGTFSSAAEVAVGNGPINIALGDLNGDGALDLAVTNRLGASVSIRLNACDPNLAPVVTVPDTQTVAEDGQLVFSTTNGNAVSAADPEVGSTRPVRASLTVSSGTLTLGTTSGLDFTGGIGDGVADPSTTFTGTLTAVNAALNGLRYDPTPQFNGSAQLTVSVNDLGQSGFDGPKTGGATVPIVVTATNDPPVAVNDSFSVVAQTVLTVAAPGVLTNDTDIDSAPVSFTAAGVANPTNGTLVLTPNGGFTYTPNAGFAGTDTFTYRTSDGSATSNVATATITVTPIQCVPRPKVVPSPVAGGGKLSVHVESTPLNTQQNNPLQQVRFGTFQNAKVTLNGQSIASGQTVNVPAGVVFVDFTVERATPGQPTTVHFTVVDGCGEWKTFVGGGTGAGF